MAREQLGVGAELSGASKFIQDSISGKDCLLVTSALVFSSPEGKIKGGRKRERENKQKNSRPWYKFLQGPKIGGIWQGTALSVLSAWKSVP